MNNTLLTCTNAPRAMPQRPGRFTRALQNASIATPSFLIAAVMITSGAFAAVRYVNLNNAMPVAPYNSWANAATNVQAAIDVAAQGDSVWVAAATYFGSITVTNVVALYGGFAGSETGLEQRSPTANPTILDGGQTNRVVSFTAGAASGTRLDGFIIQNGRAPQTPTLIVGSGIYAANASPTICNNIIRSNNANYASGYQQGGGIWVALAPCVISNNVIIHNRAASGGGVYCSTYADCLICNNRFEANIADNNPPALGAGPFGGGAICVGAAQPKIIDNFFLGNVATNLPTYAGGYGGGIAIAGAGTPYIVGNTFLKNVALNTAQDLLADRGGAIYSEGTKSIIGNNLLAFGSSGILVITTAYGDRFRNNCVFGNAHDYVYADLGGTNGNISADPLLASQNDFHLLAGSPCINAGDNSLVLPGSVDMDGEARIAGPRVDIGADEFGSTQPFALSVATQDQNAAFSINSQINHTYVWEVSRDLVAWTPFSTNIAEGTVFKLTVPVNPGGPWFYRVADTLR